METAASTRRVTMEEVTALAKRRGFIFQSSEIYGGINGFWDYGPLGAVLKRNVKHAWWRDTVELRDDVVAFDSSIIMHPDGRGRPRGTSTRFTTSWSIAKSASTAFAPITSRIARSVPTAAAKTRSPSRATSI